jgi:glycosyltransferase involved in cell wall biosynthesis
MRQNPCDKMKADASGRVNAECPAGIEDDVSFPRIESQAQKTPGGSGAPRLSVIVPARNARLHLPRCLEALMRSARADFEVLVVDDCSTDETGQIAERYGARCLKTPVPMGPGGARNLGASQASGEVLVFVDADVVVPPDALWLIAEEFDRDAELAALFGSYDSAPAWGDFLSQYKNLMHHYVHQKSNERASTFWAGCGAIRRAVFEEFGGFNAEKYPLPSIEDIELGLRMTSAGRKIHLNPRLQVKHLKRWTVRVLLRADILCRAVPWTKLILETRQLPRDLNLTVASRISAALVTLLTLGVLLFPFSVWGSISGLRASVLLGILISLAVVLLALNWDVYAFFIDKRGLRFAMGAVLAHWFYYLYSVVVFVLLTMAHFVRAPMRARGAGRGAFGSRNAQ